MVNVKRKTQEWGRKFVRKKEFYNLWYNYINNYMDSNNII